MSEAQREHVELQIRAAYRQGLYQYAYYLELCLKTNEAPR